jgi:hypothetical protein
MAEREETAHITRIHCRFRENRSLEHETLVKPFFFESTAIGGLLLLFDFQDNESKRKASGIVLPVLVKPQKEAANMK